MLKVASASQAAWIVFGVMLAAIVGAWVFELFGYLPCDLCLKQRWAYYAVVPLAGLLAVLKPSWIRPGLFLVFLFLVASTVFGIYHAGVEWKFWEGPGTCGAGQLSDLLPDLNAPVVKCDEAAIRVLGISLAGWNAIVSAAMAAVAWRGIQSGRQ